MSEQKKKQKYIIGYRLTRSGLRSGVRTVVYESTEEPVGLEPIRQAAIKEGVLDKKGLPTKEARKFKEKRLNEISIIAVFPVSRSLILSTDSDRFQQILFPDQPDDNEKVQV